MTLLRMMFVFGLGYYLGHNNVTPESLMKGEMPKNTENSAVNVLGVPLITFEKDSNGKVPSFIIMNTLRIGVVKER